MDHPKTVEDAINNEDIMKIARKAANTFYHYLSQDEIDSCILYAIWKAINSYDTSHGSKFTTYLYNGVIMECLTQKKFNVKKNNKKINKSTKNYYFESNKIDMMDEIIKCEDPDLIYDYFYKNKSIKEIAFERGVSGETIRLKIKKCLRKIKKTLKISVL